jgi:hypothetical protein
MNLSRQKLLGPAFRPAGRPPWGRARGLALAVPLLLGASLLTQARIARAAPNQGEGGARVKAQLIITVIPDKPFTAKLLLTSEEPATVEILLPFELLQIEGGDVAAYPPKLKPVEFSDHWELHTLLRLPAGRRSIMLFRFRFPQRPPGSPFPDFPNPFFFAQGGDAGETRLCYRFNGPPAGPGNAELTEVAFQFLGQSKPTETVKGKELNESHTLDYSFPRPPGGARPRTLGIVLLVIFLMVVPLGVFFLGEIFAPAAWRMGMALLVWLVTEEASILTPLVTNENWLSTYEGGTVASVGVVTPVLIAWGLLRFAAVSSGRTTLADVSVLDRGALQHQRRLKDRYTLNLRDTEEQISQFAPALVPVHLLRQRDGINEKLAEVEATIRQLEQRLAPPPNQERRPAA